MKLFLESRGFVVETVVKAKGIFKKITLFMPNLLITDVFMKGKDGLELCKEIKSTPATKDLKIIIFSSSAKALENYEEVGADACIEKPFELFELERKIKSTLSVPAQLTLIKGVEDSSEPVYKVL